MRRFHQILFVASLLSLSWFGMLAFHEFGHVAGALATGGIVEKVVLYPLTISRTDVSPNPNPLAVVWLGPILGSTIPILVWALVPNSQAIAKQVAAFFAGFCLIANGAYVGIGSIDRVGDCGVMLKHGSPLWLLVAFGLATVPPGFYFWHHLGSARQFWADPEIIDAKLAWGSFVSLFVVVAIEFSFSPQ